jgi:hypothetical protein
MPLHLIDSLNKLSFGNLHRSEHTHGYRRMFLSTPKYLKEPFVILKTPRQARPLSDIAYLNLSEIKQWNKKLEKIKAEIDDDFFYDVFLSSEKEPIPIVSGSQDELVNEFEQRAERSMGSNADSVIFKPRSILILRQE